MARPSVKKSPAAKPPPAQPSPAPADTLDPAALAAGILDRTIRPRAADIRRLAEAVLAAGRKPAKKKKKKAEKKADGKKRKLSKIPGQKSGK